MKKILSLVVLVAAVALVGCCGGQKKAENKECGCCCPKTECAQPACPQGEKNCAECPQKATCPQAEAAPAETPAQ